MTMKREDGMQSGDAGWLEPIPTLLEFVREHPEFDRLCQALSTEATMQLGGESFFDLDTPIFIGCDFGRPPARIEDEPGFAFWRRAYE